MRIQILILGFKGLIKGVCSLKGWLAFQNGKKKLTEKTRSRCFSVQFSSDNQNAVFAGLPSSTSLIILQTMACLSNVMLSVASSSSSILWLCVFSSVTRLSLYANGSSNATLSSKSKGMISCDRGITI